MARSPLSTGTVIMDDEQMRSFTAYGLPAKFDAQEKEFAKTIADLQNEVAASQR